MTNDVLMTEPDSTARPWYHYPWAWVLLLIPLSAVLFGMLMIYTVTQHPDDLVVDNYYKEGMAINQIIALDEQAVALGVAARLLAAPDETGQLRFSVKPVNDSVIVLELFHVTDSAMDQKLLLYPDMGADDAGQVYTGQSERIAADLMAPGVWYLQLSGVDQHWRLRRRIDTPVEILEFSSP